MTRCPSCGESSVIQDDFIETEESTVCTSCGLVLSTGINLVSAPIMGHLSSFSLPSQPSSKSRYKPSPSNLPLLRVEKTIKNISLALGLDISICDYSIHVANYLREHSFQNRIPNYLAPAAIYIAMKSNKITIPLHQLSSLSNVPLKNIVKCAQRHLRLFIRSGSVDHQHDQLMLIKNVFNRIISYQPAPSFFPPAEKVKFLSSVIDNLFNFISERSTLQARTKPTIFALSFLYVLFYSSIPTKDLQGFLFFICDINSSCPKSVNRFIPVLVDFLMHSLSILTLLEPSPFSSINSVHLFLLYFPSLIKYLPLLYHATPSPINSSTSVNTSIQFRIEEAAKWLASLSTDLASSSLVFPSTDSSSHTGHHQLDFLDLHIRFLLLNGVSPTTLNGLSPSGIESLASGFHACPEEP